MLLQRNAQSSPRLKPLPSATIAIVFFFQAEDGIRALYVTGVQTCALPISAREANRSVLTSLTLEAARGVSQGPAGSRREPCKRLPSGSPRQAKCARPV